MWLGNLGWTMPKIATHQSEAPIKICLNEVDLETQWRNRVRVRWTGVLSSLHWGLPWSQFSHKSCQRVHTAASPNLPLLSDLLPSSGCLVRIPTSLGSWISTVRRFQRTRSSHRTTRRFLALHLPRVQQHRSLNARLEKTSSTQWPSSHVFWWHRKEWWTRLLRHPRYHPKAPEDDPSFASGVFFSKLGPYSRTNNDRDWEIRCILCWCLRFCHLCHKIWGALRCCTGPTQQEMWKFWEDPWVEAVISSHNLHVGHRSGSLAVGKNWKNPKRRETKYLWIQVSVSASDQGFMGANSKLGSRSAKVRRIFQALNCSYEKNKSTMKGVSLEAVDKYPRKRPPIPSCLKMLWKAVQLDK